MEMSFAALDQIVGRLDSEGVSSLLVYNATNSERLGVHRPERDVLIEWAEARGLSTMDLTRDQQVSLNDNIHPDADGAAQIAIRLRDWLLPQIPCG